MILDHTCLTSTPWTIAFKPLCYLIAYAQVGAPLISSLLLLRAEQVRGGLLVVAELVCLSLCLKKGVCAGKLAKNYFSNYLVALIKKLTSTRRALSEQVTWPFEFWPVNFGS